MMNENQQLRAKLAAAEDLLAKKDQQLAEQPRPPKGQAALLAA